MSLLDLATETLLSIAEELIRESDINALVRTNRHFHRLLNLYLYQRNHRGNRYSGLLWAAKHGHVSTIQKWLEAGGEIGTVATYNNATVLHVASAMGHLQIVALLITSGVCVDAQTWEGYTPLHAAIVNQFESVAMALIEKGADVRKPWPGGQKQTVLHIASYFGLTLVVRFLLENGEDIDTGDAQSQTPLHWAVKTSRVYDGNYGAPENNLLHFSPWMTKSWRPYGIWRGILGTVRLLLESGANVDVQDHTGNSVQHLAKRHPENVVRMMFNGSLTVDMYKAELRRWEFEERQRLKKEKEINELMDRRRRSIKVSRENGLVIIEGWL